MSSRAAPRIIRVVKAALLTNTLAFKLYRKAHSDESILKDEYQLKKATVASRAVDAFVRNDMCIGIGTGSTSSFFAIERIGELVANGKLKNITVIAATPAGEKHCQDLQLPVRGMDSLDLDHSIDIMIDGADEVDLQLNVLKGSKGQLVRERMMWHAALQRVVVISNEGKLVKKLGLSSPLPVEVISWGSEFVRSSILQLPAIRGARAVLRKGSVTTHYSDGMRPAVTESGNYVIDIFFDKPIDDAHELAQEISSVPGVVSHGLFIGLATTIVCALPNNSIRFVGHPPAGNSAEPAYWGEAIPHRPLETETVDNRRVV